MLTPNEIQAMKERDKEAISRGELHPDAPITLDRHKLLLDREELQVEIARLKKPIEPIELEFYRELCKTVPPGGHVGVLRENAERLIRELDSLRRDKERLDWLEEAKPNLFCLCVFGDSTIIPDTEPKQREPEPTGYVWEINTDVQNPILRDAIDAAIARERK